MADGGNASHSVLVRTLLSSAGMAIQGVGRFAYTWAVGRFLGPQALGEVSALLSLSVYAALFWPAGLAVTASRFLASPGTSVASLRYLRGSFWVAISVITPAFAVVAAFLTRDVALAVTTAVLIMAYSGYTFTRGALIGQDRLVTAAVWDGVASAATLLLVAGVIVGRWHWALMLPLALGYLLFTIAAWPHGQAEPVTPAYRAELRGYTLSATLGALATGGLLPATMVFVRAFDEPTAGYFGAALSLATPLSMLSQALNQVLIPHFSRQALSDPEAAVRTHRKILLLTCVGFLAGFGLMITLAPWLITFVFGDEYAAGTQAMQVLLAIVAAMSCMSAPSALLMAVGRHARYAQIWGVSTVIGIATMAVASPSLGQWGALVGYAIGGAGGAVAVTVAALAWRPPVPALLDDPKENVR